MDHSMTLRILCSTLLLLSSCALNSEPGSPGPEGPQGPDGEMGGGGPEGATGATGPEGPSGVSPFAYVDEELKTDIYYSGGNVGLGTTSPARHLHVFGAPDSAEAKMRIGEGENNGAVAAELLLETTPVGTGALTLDVAKNGVGRGDILLAKYGGHVGIGTPAPLVLLDVRDADSATHGTITTGTSDLSHFLSLFGSGAPPALFWHAGDALRFAVADDANATAFTELLRITPSGNVSIGTTNSQARLHVAYPDVNGMPQDNYTVLLASGSGGFTHNLHVDSTGGGALLMTNVLLGGGSITADNYIIGHNLGVGTTSPQATLDINGTARLAKYSSPPLACDAAHDGTIALTHLYRMCVCNGSSWVQTSDGAGCSW